MLYKRLYDFMLVSSLLLGLLFTINCFREKPTDPSKKPSIVKSICSCTPEKHTVTTIAEFDAAWENLCSGDTIYIPQNTTIQWTDYQQGYADTNKTLYFIGDDTTSVLNWGNLSTRFLSLLDDCSYNLQFKNIKFILDSSNQGRFLYVLGYNLVQMENVVFDIKSNWQPSGGGEGALPPGTFCITADTLIADGCDFRLEGQNVVFYHRNQSGYCENDFYHYFTNSRFYRINGNLYQVGFEHFNKEGWIEYHNCDFPATSQGGQFGAFDFNNYFPTDIEITLRFRSNEFYDRKYGFCKDAGTAGHVNLLFAGNELSSGMCPNEDWLDATCGDYDNAIVWDLESWTYDDTLYSMDDFSISNIQAYWTKAQHAADTITVTWTSSEYNCEGVVEWDDEDCDGTLVSAYDFNVGSGTAHWAQWTLSSWTNDDIYYQVKSTLCDSTIVSSCIQKDYPRRGEKVPVRPHQE